MNNKTNENNILIPKNYSVLCQRGKFMKIALGFSLSFALVLFLSFLMTIPLGFLLPFSNSLSFVS